MRKTTYSAYLTILATLVLTACGGNDDTLLDPRYRMDEYGNCTIPSGYKDQTVVGSFGNGATLTLDIFSQQGGTIAAVGMLSIPSIEALYGTNVFGGTFDPYNQHIGGYGYGGGYSERRLCVSSNGFNGTLEDDSVLQYINITLRGNDGSFLQMGNTIGFMPAAIVGSSIEGNVRLFIAGYNYPETDFMLTRE